MTDYKDSQGNYHLDNQKNRSNMQIFTGIVVKFEQDNTAWVQTETGIYRMLYITTNPERTSVLKVSNHILMTQKKYFNQNSKKAVLGESDYHKGLLPTTWNRQDDSAYGEKYYAFNNGEFSDEYTALNNIIAFFTEYYDQYGNKQYVIFGFIPGGAKGPGLKVNQNQKAPGDLYNHYISPKANPFEGTEGYNRQDFSTNPIAYFMKSGTTIERSPGGASSIQQENGNSYRANSAGAYISESTSGEYVGPRDLFRGHYLDNQNSIPLGPNLSPTPQLHSGIFADNQIGQPIHVDPNRPFQSIPFVNCEQEYNLTGVNPEQRNFNIDWRTYYQSLHNNGTDNPYKKAGVAAVQLQEHATNLSNYSFKAGHPEGGYLLVDKDRIKIQGHGTSLFEMMEIKSNTIAKEELKGKPGAFVGNTSRRAERGSVDALGFHFPAALPGGPGSCQTSMVTTSLCNTVQIYRPGGYLSADDINRFYKVDDDPNGDPAPNRGGVNNIYKRNAGKDFKAAGIDKKYYKYKYYDFNNVGGFQAAAAMAVKRNPAYIDPLCFQGLKMDLKLNSFTSQRQKDFLSTNTLALDENSFIYQAARYSTKGEMFGKDNLNNLNLAQESSKNMLILQSGNHPSDQYNTNTVKNYRGPQQIYMWSATQKKKTILTKDAHGKMDHLLNNNNPRAMGLINSVNQHLIFDELNNIFEITDISNENHYHNFTMQWNNNKKTCYLGSYEPNLNNAGNNATYIYMDFQNSIIELCAKTINFKQANVVNVDKNHAGIMQGMYMREQIDYGAFPRLNED